MALRKVTAALTGAVVALMPALALAEGESGALDAAGDFSRVALLTVLGVGGLLLVSAIGYLYRRERDLGWDFQKPDPDGHGEAH